MHHPLLISVLLVALPVCAQDTPKLISLKEAIETALINNLQVGLAEATRDISKADILVEDGAFHWNLTGSVNWAKTKAQSQQQLSLGGTFSTIKTTSWNRDLSLGIDKPFEWGGALNFQYQPTYAHSVSVTSNGIVPAGNTPYGGSISASYTQSLLRNFGCEANASRLLVALANRLELKADQLDLESKVILERAANNHMLLKLDLTVGYTGNARSDGSLKTINSDLTGMKYPGYNMGVAFAVPLLNRNARGGQIKARAARRFSELTLSERERTITLEVRQAVRNLEATGLGMAAAERTRTFRVQNLEAEQKKFENGLSTNFLVLRCQDELDGACSAALQAQINHVKAITVYEKATGLLLEVREFNF